MRGRPDRQNLSPVAPIAKDGVGRTTRRPGMTRIATNPHGSLQMAITRAFAGPGLRHCRCNPRIPQQISLPRNTRAGQSHPGQLLTFSGRRGMQARHLDLNEKWVNNMPRHACRTQGREDYDLAGHQAPSLPLGHMTRRPEAIDERQILLNLSGRNARDARCPKAAVSAGMSTS